MSQCKAFVVALILVLAAPVAVQAQDDLGVSIAEGSDQKVRRRAYPGGRDDEDLKVQASLPQPSRDPDVRAVPTSVPADEPAHD